MIFHKTQHIRGHANKKNHDNLTFRDEIKKKTVV